MEFHQIAVQPFPVGNCKVLKVNNPILTTTDLLKIKEIDGLPAFLGHGQDTGLKIIIGIAKGFLHPLPLLVPVLGHPPVGDL